MKVDLSKRTMTLSKLKNPSTHFSNRRTGGLCQTLDLNPCCGGFEIGSTCNNIA